MENLSYKQKFLLQRVKVMALQAHLHVLKAIHKLIALLLVCLE